jgi:Nuclease-related domain
LSYARRQGYRRLAHAGTSAAASIAAAVLGLALAGAGAATAAAVSLLAAVALGLYARRWLALAGRSRVGARSEAEVRRRLAVLQGEGWRLRHSLPWRGRGDIDLLALAPTRVGFVIETKRRAYDDRHPAPVCDQAAWLSRRRRRWCRRGAVPVVCLLRARGVQRFERNVLVVSIDRLIPVLRSAAGRVGRPADEVGVRRFGRRGRFE